MKTESSKQTHSIALLYRFLAECMKYPSPAWLTEDFIASFCEVLRALGAEDEASSLSRSCSDNAAFIEDLQIEYTRLFINGIPHVIAPPYGSVYLDGSLQGQSTERTKRYYLEKGYDMAETADLPDHLVHELEFLSHLAENDDQEGEHYFLRTFFLPWFTPFKNRVLSESRHPYYRLVISTIDYFTKEEE